MNPVFADAVYWVALAHTKDQWHPRSVVVSRTLGGVQLVTPEAVLSAFLAHFSGYGTVLRQAAVRFVESVGNDKAVAVRPQSHESFVAGLDLYKARPDKGYSLTDCISMVAMREEGITEVLTHDEHFAQEGFQVLL
jgi:predicted nucleic acid-binding protein